MANKNLVSFQVLLICSSFLLMIFPQYSCNAQNVRELKHCGFDAIYNLGSSVSDTGNLMGSPAYQTKFPYGKTINKATGRSSDGWLIIDYIAKSADLPLVDPFKNLGETHRGVNFAVAGATTLSNEALAEKNIFAKFAPVYLGAQLAWLDKYLEGYCHNPEACQNALKSSLFTINFGYNDYYAALSSNQTITEMKKNGLVTEVVKSIKDAVSKVIDQGAKNVLVFGVAKDGCRPITVNAQSANKSATYDGFGCAKDINDFCLYHNQLLQEALEELRKEHPNAQIVDGDFYNAMQSLLDNFESLGFKSLLTPCCDVKNKDQVTEFKDKLCGAINTIVCSKIEEYVYWDFAHWTQKANQYLANWIIQDIFPKFRCKA